jgi:hypothetical protein
MQRFLVAGAALALVVLSACDPADVAAKPRIAKLGVPENADAPESWKPYYAALASLGDGFVTWESRRNGKWRIWMRPLDGGPERQLSPDEPGRDHVAAHISPDGRHVVYLSLPAPHDDFDMLPERVKAPLHIARIEGGRVVEDRVLVPNARTYQQSRAALWVNARELIYLAADVTTRQLDIVTGEEKVLIAHPQTKLPLLVNATHTHATNGVPTFSVYHESDGSVARRARLSGCQPYFTPDGRLGYWVSDAGGPISKLDLLDGTSSDVISRDSDWLPKGRRYVYYPMASADQRLLAFAASDGKHGHFDVDFDVFVAPLDPERFEVIGPAVRFTFTQEIERFPDVFVSGYELGRLHGEAPYAVTLHPDPDEPVDGWRFDFGDGSAPGADATHRYEKAGTYRVTAERGGRKLGGEVTVTAGTPPKVLRAEVLPGGREISVLFDERIDVANAKAAFASGVPIAELGTGERERELLLKLAAPFTGKDELQLEGVADRAAVPHAIAPTRVPIEAVVWPGPGDGLVFAWGDDRTRVPVKDVDTGHPREFSFLAHDRARIDGYGALRVGTGWFEAEDVPAGLVPAIKQADAFTIELTVTPDRDTTDDPAHILSLGFDAKSQNVSLSQHGRVLELRLRNEHEGEKDHDVVELAQLEKGKATHFLVSFRPGRILAFRDGTRVLDTDKLPGNLSVWRDGAKLALGADPDGGRRFAGTIEGVAIYARAFEPAEAAAHANAYRHQIASREPVKRVRVRARLAAESPPPTPEQIVPYREALVLREYVVPPKKQDRLGGERVRVAHWAVLDGQSQPLPTAKNGKRTLLVLEPWEAYPRLEGAYVSDTLDPDPEIPLYVEVSN